MESLIRSPAVTSTTPEAESPIAWRALFAATLLTVAACSSNAMQPAADGPSDTRSPNRVESEALGFDLAAVQRSIMSLTSQGEEVIYDGPFGLIPLCESLSPDSLVVGPIRSTARRSSSADVAIFYYADQMGEANAREFAALFASASEKCPPSYEVREEGGLRPVELEPLGTQAPPGFVGLRAKLRSPSARVEVFAGSVGEWALVVGRVSTGESGGNVSIADLATIVTAAAT